MSIRRVKGKIKWRPKQAAAGRDQAARLAGRGEAAYSEIKRGRSMKPVDYWPAWEVGLGQ